MTECDKKKLTSTVVFTHNICVGSQTGPVGILVYAQKAQWHLSIELDSDVSKM